MNFIELNHEFNRQVNILLQKEYPSLAQLSEQDFISLLSPLEKHLENIELPEIDIEKGILPFVLVVKNTLLPSETMMNMVEKDGIHGVTILKPHTSVNFQPIDDIHLPNKDIYVLIHIDRGEETLNVRPKDALQQIKNQKRSPLTIDEGIAVLNHFPEILIKNHCFSLLGSRTGTDKRVPALWINSKKEPNLGWCWDGNPHTWLGSASCMTRTGD